MHPVIYILLKLAAKVVNYLIEGAGTAFLFTFDTKMKKLRFALVGCGNIGQRHAPLIAAAGQLSAVCDPVPERFENLARQYGSKAYRNLQDLLHIENSLDVAVICTPNYLHAEQAITCLNSGMHVLCEKPIAIHSTDGENMLKAAANVNKKLFVVQQNRYNPPVEAVKKLLDENGLGEVHAFQVNCFWNRTAAYYDNPWKGKKDLDGGILYTQFSHFIDILLWFLGEAVSIRPAFANYLLQDVVEMEDTGFAIIKMQNGATGTLNYTVTSFSKNMEGSITLFGEKGTVKIGGQYLNTLEYFQVDQRNPPLTAPTAPANNYGFYQGSMSNHDIVYKNLVNALEEKPFNLVQGSEALRSVRFIEQLYRAAP